MSTTYFIDGFCIAHHKHFLTCEECWSKYQAQMERERAEQTERLTDILASQRRIRRNHYNFTADNPYNDYL